MNLKAYFLNNILATRILNLFKGTRWRWVFYIIIILVFLLPLTYYTKFTASSDFPLNTIFTVPSGVGLNGLAIKLHSEKVIRSPFLFKSLVVVFGGPNSIRAGDYVLDIKSNVVVIAWRMVKGDFHLQVKKVVFPEGLNIYEMANLISKKFPEISEVDFFLQAKDLEGYLFPDTYYFLPNATTKEIIRVMRDNFDKRISTIAEKLKNFKYPLIDIIKMASIIEEEVVTDKDRKIVAGILWRRLEINMPLQVDPTVKYINAYDLDHRLSQADFKIDSPYNSYLYKGLPPTPISNPGLESILATITPTVTDFMYFLSDKKGNIHYAETYKEHLQNKKMYLE